MATIVELEARIAHLESIIDPANGNIETKGNLSLQGTRDWTNPLKFYMGKDATSGLYFFFQQRPPGQGSDIFAGLETFERLDSMNPSWGYGYWPMRFWGQNFLLEANGDNVSRNVVAERIYLQSPAHRNMQTGAFEKPDHYDQFGVPFTADGQQMGGIYYDKNDLEVYLTREGREVVLYNNGNRTVLG